MFPIRQEAASRTFQVVGGADRTVDVVVLGLARIECAWQFIYSLSNLGSAGREAGRVTCSGLSGL